MIIEISQHAWLAVMFAVCPQEPQPNPPEGSIAVSIPLPGYACKINKIPLVVSYDSENKHELWSVSPTAAELLRHPGLSLGAKFGSLEIKSTKVGSVPQTLDSVTFGLDWIPLAAKNSDGTPAEFGTLDPLLVPTEGVGWGAILYIDQDNAVRAFTWGGQVDGSVMDLGGEQAPAGQTITVWGPAEAKGQIDALDYNGWMFTSDAYAACFTAPPGSVILPEFLYCEEGGKTSILVKDAILSESGWIWQESRMVFKGLAEPKFANSHFTSLAYDRKHGHIVFSVDRVKLQGDEKPEDSPSFYVMRVSELRSTEGNKTLNGLQVTTDPVPLRKPNGQVWTSTRPKGACGIDPHYFRRGREVNNKRPK